MLLFFRGCLLVATNLHIFMRQINDLIMEFILEKSPIKYNNNYLVNMKTEPEIFFKIKLNGHNIVALWYGNMSRFLFIYFFVFHQKFGFFTLMQLRVIMALVYRPKSGVHSCTCTQTHEHVPMDVRSSLVGSHIVTESNFFLEKKIHHRQIFARILDE